MKTKMKTKIKVNFKDQVTTVEILSDEIVAISRGIKNLRAGRLNEKALILLIQHASKPTQPYGNKITSAQVREVLNGIQDLEKTYLTKKV